MTPDIEEKIINLLLKQRRNVKIDNNLFLDALIYICENGCTWCALPAYFGPWYTRLANGIFIYLFEIKDNRLAAASEQEKEKGRFNRIDRMGIPDEEPVPTT